MTRLILLPAYFLMAVPIVLTYALLVAVVDARDWWAGEAG
jgi:hypothetical protein